MRRHLPFGIAGLAALAASACLLEQPTALEETGETLGPNDPTSAWVGDYLGDGEGQIDGQTVRVEDARLRVTLDAASVRLASCPRCVTVTLDSVFKLVNVRLTDPVEMDLAYDDGPVRYTLLVRRYSASGEVGNTVTARVTIGNAGVPTPFFDVSYLLTRP